jgi:hypothetical protein
MKRRPVHQLHEYVFRIQDKIYGCELLAGEIVLEFRKPSDLPRAVFWGEVPLLGGHTFQFVEALDLGSDPLLFDDRQYTLVREGISKPILRTDRGHHHRPVLHLHFAGEVLCEASFDLAFDATELLVRKTVTVEPGSIQIE